MIKSLIIAGVGGQGILLAADIFSKVLTKKGFDVKTSEVHGMSQRGGDIISTIRWGEKVYSPLIGKNSADYILALEKLEAMRNLPYLKSEGTIIVNNYQLNPLPVSSGLAAYPDNITEFLKSQVNNVFEIDAFDAALKLGNARVMNIIILGGLAGITGIKEDIWLEIIESSIPQKYIQINIEAFKSGYSKISEKLNLIQVKKS